MGGSTDGGSFSGQEAPLLTDCRVRMVNQGVCVDIDPFFLLLGVRLWLGLLVQPSERSSRAARAESPGLLGWLPQHKPPFGSHRDLALSSHRQTKLALDVVEVRKTGCEVVI